MQAQWIGLNNAEYPEYQVSAITTEHRDGGVHRFCIAEFCNEYCYEVSVKELQLDISADTCYRIWINGEWVGRGPCRHGGDFEMKKALPYRYFDHYTVPVSGNQIQIYVQVLQQPPVLADLSCGIPGLWMQGQVILEDDSSGTIVTDHSWKCRRDIRYTGDSQADFSRRPLKWSAAAIKSYPAELRPAVVPVMVQEWVRPVQPLQLSAVSGEVTEAIAEFDKIYCGYLHLKVSGKGRVILRCEEVERYAGEEVYEYDGDHEILSMRMRSLDHCRIRLENLGGSNACIEEFGLWFEHYPVEQTGTFRCSDEGLNKVFEICKHTLLMCDQSIHLDSPMHQELLACTGDYYIESLMERSVSSMTELTRADILRTAEILRLKEGQMFHTTYSLIWIQMVHDYILYSGDETILDEIRDAIQILLDRFDTYITESGLPEKAPNYMFVDWMVTDGYSLHHPPKALGLSVLSAFYYRALIVADQMGFDCIRQAEALKEAFQQLYIKERGLYCEGLGTPDLVPTYQWLPENVNKTYYAVYANALAVLYDLCQEDQSQELLRRTLSDAELNDVQPYFMHFVLEAVWHAGLWDEFGLKILRRWIPVVEECDKGLAEGWNKPQEDYSFDHSHAWGGTPLYQLPARLLGLEILEPGMKKIRLDPQLWDLKWAEIAYPTPYGPIYCKMAGRMRPEVQVPDEIEVIWN